MLFKGNTLNEKNDFDKESNTFFKGLIKKLINCLNSFRLTIRYIESENHLLTN
jgi:hypothetical protein